MSFTSHQCYKSICVSLTMVVALWLVVLDGFGFVDGGSSAA